jgi:hypothetical protein
VANAKIAEVKNHERALISNYGSLHSEYGGFGICICNAEKRKR